MCKNFKIKVKFKNWQEKKTRLNMLFFIAAELNCKNFNK